MIIMKTYIREILIIFLILKCFHNYSQIINKSEKIKTFIIGPTNNSNDIFILNEIVQFSFDELSLKKKNYYYKIDHYDFDWKLSNVNKSEYIDGFDEVKIKDISYSFNTLKSYTNYKFSIPNNQIKIKESGNYKVSIYDSYGAKITEKRFTIVDNKFPIQLGISRTKDLDNYQIAQKISFNIMCGNCNELYNNYSEIKIILRKNNNWNNIIKVEKPKYLTSTKAVYDDIIFYGGNEFNNFDTSQIKSNNYRIKNWSLSDIYESFLVPDEFDKNEIYNYNPDINGGFVIDSNEKENNNYEADYVRVFFEFKKSNFNTKDEIYLIGKFNDFNENNHYKLSFDSSINSFTGSFLFKQGFYNYKYASKIDLNSNKLKNIENNFWQTENLYTVLIYFKKNYEKFFRVIGFNTLNSTSIKN